MSIVGSYIRRAHVLVELDPDRVVTQTEVERRVLFMNTNPFIDESVIKRTLRALEKDLLVIHSETPIERARVSPVGERRTIERHYELTPAGRAARETAIRVIRAHRERNLL